MITLYLINKVAFLLNYFIANFFSGAHYTAISNIGSNLSSLTIPSQLTQILQLCLLFLPVGTIAILFNITLCLLSVRFVFGLIHFIAHIGGIR